ncbi:hypothetical protein [Pseudomonas phage UF_RH7]|nr:hypothetical protein [Pseudomonas phage UF_RH7]
MIKFKIMMIVRLLLSGVVAVAGLVIAGRYWLIADDLVNAAIVVIIAGVVVSICAPDAADLEDLQRLIEK